MVEPCICSTVILSSKNRRVVFNLLFQIRQFILLVPLCPSLKLQDSLQESGFLSLFFGRVATASAAVSGDRNVVLEQLFHELQVLLVERVGGEQDDAVEVPFSPPCFPSSQTEPWKTRRETPGSGYHGTQRPDNFQRNVFQIRVIFVVQQTSK